MLDKINHWFEYLILKFFNVKRIMVCWLVNPRLRRPRQRQERRENQRRPPKRQATATLRSRTAGSKAESRCRAIRKTKSKFERKFNGAQLKLAATNSAPSSRHQPLGLAGLLGAEGVHYVNAGGAGCWQHRRYYRSGQQHCG
jgi:hypothetical protein